VLANRNVPNGAEPILKVIGGLPPGTPAASGAAYGTSWLVQLLEDYGFAPHLVHPSRCKAIASARLKNDRAGAAILGQLLRADLLPEAWIAPPPVRALRALLRHRVHLVRLRTRLRNRIHAIVAGYGYDRPGGGYWSGPGRAWLAALALPAVSRELAGDYLGLIDALQGRIDRLDWEIRQRARSGPRVKVLTQLPGIGPFTALVILAEAGDVRRFGPARQLASWAGLIPTVRGSDRVAHYGHIWKGGLGVAALGAVRGGADRQALPAVRRRLPAHCETAGEEDRHHGGRPQTGHPRLLHRRQESPAERRHTPVPVQVSKVWAKERSSWSGAPGPSWPAASTGHASNSARRRSQTPAGEIGHRAAALLYFAAVPGPPTVGSGFRIYSV
jgi:transposase